MDEDRRLRWLESVARLRHLRTRQADAAVADCTRAWDVAAKKVAARQAEVSALSSWRLQAAARPQLDLGMLQQSMTMAASAETALTDAQAELETCANARERALGEQLLASRREDRASKQHDAAHLAGTIVQERRQSEQSLEAWSRRKPA